MCALSTGNSAPRRRQGRPYVPACSGAGIHKHGQDTPEIGAYVAVISRNDHQQPNGVAFKEPVGVI